MALILGYAAPREKTGPSDLSRYEARWRQPSAERSKDAQACQRDGQPTPAAGASPVQARVHRAPVGLLLLIHLQNHEGS
jgi:hypothetical protein